MRLGSICDGYDLEKTKPQDGLDLILSLLVNFVSK